MKASDFRGWREQSGLSQQDAASKLGVVRATIQNWESGATSIPSVVDLGCKIWGDRLRQIRPDVGPVTLVYSDGPAFINPYGPRRPLARMHQEPYPTNAAALARTRSLVGRDDFHNPFILDEAGKFLWNGTELENAARGHDLEAPLWRRLIISRSTRDETAADADCKALLNTCSRAYKSKYGPQGFPRDVLIFRDRMVPDDYIFYFSPAAFALSSEIRNLVNSVEICDEPLDQTDLVQIIL